MTFDLKLASDLEKWFICLLHKEEFQSIKKKIITVYDKISDNLFTNLDKLANTESIKLFVTTLGHIFTKKITIRYKFNQDGLNEAACQSWIDKAHDPF